jgi:hypothetical protein
MAIEHAIGEGGSHAEARRSGHGVLKAAQSWLGGKRRIPLGIKSHESLVKRVVPEPGHIVGVAIAAGNGKDALPQKTVEGVTDLGLVPSVGQAADQGVGQTQRIVQGTKKDGTPVRGHRGVAEADVKRLNEKVWQEDGLRCKLVTHWKPSFCVFVP